MSEPLSREFLLNQKECCGSTCTNCPYIPKFRKGSTKVSEV